MKRRRSARALRCRYGHAHASRLAAVLDNVLDDLHDAKQKVETAHELAPNGAAKTIVAGLHSDLFNTTVEFRKYIGQVKRLAEE